MKIDGIQKVEWQFPLDTLDHDAWIEITTSKLHKNFHLTSKRHKQTELCVFTLVQIFFSVYLVLRV